MADQRMAVGDWGTTTLRSLFAVCAASFVVGPGLCADLDLATANLKAQFAGAALTSLEDSAGRTLVREADVTPAGAIRRIQGDHLASGPARANGDGARVSDVAGLAGGRLEWRAEADAGGDLVVTESAESPEPGVWGVSWAIGEIPLDMNVIVPGRSGIRLDAAVPGSRHEFDYPIGWEAQLVIVEGAGHGFYVWADDAVGEFKRLEVERSRTGWRLILTSINPAPFDALTTCRSAKWRLNTYEGDWRVPARRYRDWMAKNLRPIPVTDQRPAWIGDIRCCVIMGLEIPVIEKLAERIDPTQTLLYLPGWRTEGYDRDYPTYDQIVPELDPFIVRAHELGYKVMLHVNYFGCDPLNPLYEQLAPYQCRDPLGQHDRLWWLWERADPIIKFAYIDPAHKPWRDLFIQRMTTLCADHAVDALHLDQTLCMFNDSNGLIDGQNMIQGNIALHRELREALPNVALSGEGLDEVTYRYEAFAQRHAWGINHADGTFDPTWLRTAHPISSYLLAPYTTIYGYLGYAPPTDGQLYAAWNEAYEHWGVIPTLKPDVQQIAAPTGFSRQFFDEAAPWLAERVDIDGDAEWPADAAFVFRTRSGERVVRTLDHRLLFGDREVSRTVTGVTELDEPGSIPGWPAYDAKRIFGLDANTYYPYVGEPRDMEAFHVEQLPDGFGVSSVVETDGAAIIATRQTGGVVADLVNQLASAEGGSGPMDGEPVPTLGAFENPDGAVFVPSGSAIDAHPPWKLGKPGLAFVRYGIDLPAQGDIRFISQVVMRPGAMLEGRSDGVTYRVTAHAGDDELQAELHHASETPADLILDLTPFAGRHITLELLVHPGPKGDPSYDWARWVRPRVEQRLELDGEVVFVSPTPYALALSGTATAQLDASSHRHSVPAHLPGGVCLLAERPAPLALPVDLLGAPLPMVRWVPSQGVTRASTETAPTPATATVGGVTRRSIFAHPPDHGLTMLVLQCRLPEAPAEFHSYIGVGDGSKSEGVTFRVEVNGTVLAERPMLPGAWAELTCDLAQYAGKPAVIALVTDADGSFFYDWSHWAEPVIRAR